MNGNCCWRVVVAILVNVGVPAVSKKSNVLMFAADDLRPQLGCYSPLPSAGKHVSLSEYLSLLYVLHLDQVLGRSERSNSASALVRVHSIRIETQTPLRDATSISQARARVELSLY